MTVDYYHWFNVNSKPILIKVVITPNPSTFYVDRWAFSILEHGKPVEIHNRYRFVTTDEELESDLEDCAG